MLGYDTGDADLSGVELAAIWADDGETGPGDVLAQALAGGWQGEARHVTRDGGHVEVLASIFPLADESGSTDRLAMIAQDVTERKRAEEAMLLQNEAIMEMSTPVISISEGVLLLPLVGVMDSERAAQVIDRLLGEIAATEAEVAILDVTGVPVVDTAVARNILRTVEAARVLGAEVIVTGFGPAAAQTLATLNVDFSALRTRGSLRAGVTEAYMLTGIELSRRKAK